MTDQARRAGRGGYVLALALVLIGFALFAAAVVPAKRAVSEAVEGLQRVVVAGAGDEASFFVDEPGVVFLHYEPITRIGGTAYATETTWEPELLLRTAGAMVSLEPTPSTVVYRTDGRAGHSLFQAELPAAGLYSVAVAEPGLAGNVATGIAPAADRPRVLAIGNVPVGRLKDGLVGVYGGAVAMGLLGCIAVMVGLITWARRHGTKTERIDGQPTAW